MSEMQALQATIVGPATLYQADCRDVLRSMPDASVDSVVTDPPYALVSIVKRFGGKNAAPPKDYGPGNGLAAYTRSARGFMGQTWDTGEVAFSDEFWAEVLRVLKPGGHVVAFSGTRTYHRMAVAIEDAGFEIRDQLGWLYGSGFPKSHNQHDEWEGWGTALKPAWEPICLARKALVGTVAANLALHGVGALNIDGCRVEFESGDTTASAASAGTGSGNSSGVFGQARSIVSPPHTLGRWPANIVHDGSDEVVAAFPDAGGQQGDLNETGRVRPTKTCFGNMAAPKPHAARVESDKSAARFFYAAKASRADREQGLDGFTKGVTSDGRAVAADNAYQRGATERANTHPTVKPTSLMQWLCRLVTPPGGVVLDPFMGSGSTGKATLLEGFRFIGCEREDEYMPIAEARIRWALDEMAPKPAADNDNSPQLSLFGAA